MSFAQKAGGVVVAWHVQNHGKERHGPWISSLSDKIEPVLPPIRNCDLAHETLATEPGPTINHDIVYSSELWHERRPSLWDSEHLPSDKSEYLNCYYDKFNILK